MRPKLYFCFPYHGVGGVSLLFLRLAEELAQRGLAECALVDYADGFMAKHRDPALTTLVEYADDGEVAIPGDAVAVFQSMTPWSIFPALRLAPQTRVLFWNCHPFNLVPTLPGMRQPMQHSLAFGRLMLVTVLRGYRNRIRRLVALLLSRGSLVFMDRANVANTEDYLGVSVGEPVYLPIPAQAPATVPAKPPRDLRAQGLRLAWVGRLVDFKYQILKYTLQQLNRLQPETGLHFEIIVVGSGDFGEELRADVAPLGNIAVRFIDYIAPDQLDAFLLEQTDMLMAMGTSALEGAKLGVPTLLLDVAYGKIPDGYVFQWLHERKGFVLGDMIRAENLVPGNRSLADRIGEMLEDYPALSRKAAEHFRQHHALAGVAPKLLAIVQQARCTWSELAVAGLVKRGVLYSTFTVLRKGWTKA
jgi:glycosyltransferase involved in cell wall biosynthesis